MDEEIKKLLADVFSILDFSDEEKSKALMDFEKKVASEVLQSITQELPMEYREFLVGEGLRMTDPQNPMVLKMKEFIKNLHGKEEYQARARKIFEKLFKEYINYMRDGLSADKVDLLDKRLKEFAW